MSNSFFNNQYYVCLFNCARLIGLITIMFLCVRVCVSECAYLCNGDDSKQTKFTCHFLLPHVLSSQTAVLTCATGTASAPWDSRVGTANARRAGGAPAAVSPWRPPAPTTRTTKEVSRERTEHRCKKKKIMY